jgi:hypothetical protein
MLALAFLIAFFFFRLVGLRTRWLLRDQGARTVWIGIEWENENCWRFNYKNVTVVGVAKRGFIVSHYTEETVIKDLYYIKAISVMPHWHDCF